MNRKKARLLLTVCLSFLLTVEADCQQTDEASAIYSKLHQAADASRYDLLPGIDSMCTRLVKATAVNPKQSAIILLVQGAIRTLLFRLTEALPLLNQSLQLCETNLGKTSPEALEAKTYLSWVYGYTGNHKMEYRYYDELLRYYKSNSRKYALEIADMYNTVGTSYEYNYGDWNTELLYLDSAKYILESYVPQNAEQSKKRVLHLVNIYNSLSVTHFHSSNYEAAQSYARKCLALRKQIAPESMENAIAWMTLGRSFYLAENNMDSCLFYLDKAVRATENDFGRLQWTSYKAYKAEILIKDGQLDKGIAEAASALDYLRKLDKLDLSHAGSYVKLACVQSKAYMEKKDYKKALLACEDAKNRIPQSDSLSNVFQLLLFTQYATAFCANRQWEQAAAQFKSIVSKTGITMKQLTSPVYTIPDKIPYECLSLYKQVGNYLVEKGLAIHKNADVIDGVNVLKKTAQALARQRTLLFEAVVEEGLGAQNLDIYDDLLEALYRAGGYIDEKQRMADAFNTIELSKAHLLKNSLLQETLFNNILPDSVNKKRIDLKRRFYEAVNIYRQPEKYIRRGNQDDFLNIKEDYTKFLQEIKKKYAFNELKEKSLITVDDTTLGRHRGTIVNYFLASKHLYAFVHENGVQKFVRKDIPAGFRADLAFVRKNGLVKQAVSDDVGWKKMRQIMKQWYRWLLDDVALNGELVIIPHKELSQISFEILDENKDPQQTSYLIEKLPVRYELSASVLHLKEALPANNDIKTFGGFAASDFKLNQPGNAQADEILSEFSRGSIQNLKGTEVEIKQIASMCNGDLYLNTKPNDFIENASKYKILHVATHALSDQGPYHECILIFETDSKGNYTVRDIQIDSLQLNAQMAVLSACNTGTGKLHSDEGMLSLGRSFFLAGCPSVVMSLWTVNDVSTSKIMSSFYHYLQLGQTKSEALRNAQLTYLKSETNVSKKHPYYWAGFIVVGDNAPISFTGSDHSNTVFWVICSVLIGIVSLAVGLYLYRKKRRSAV